MHFYHSTDDISEKSEASTWIDLRSRRMSVSSAPNSSSWPLLVNSLSTFNITILFFAYHTRTRLITLLLYLRLRRGGYAIRGVHLSVCWSVSRITKKSNRRILLTFSGKVKLRPTQSHWILVLISVWLQWRSRVFFVRVRVSKTRSRVHCRVLHSCLYPGQNWRILYHCQTR